MAAGITISFAGSALRDLEGILEYYTDQQAPQAGERLVANVIKAIELLVEQPDMGRVVPEFDMKNLRELIRPPFRIVYRREPDKVRIVRMMVLP
jgi:plasmid stabilization system protein ParE